MKSSGPYRFGCSFTDFLSALPLSEALKNVNAHKHVVEVKDLKNKQCKDEKFTIVAVATFQVLNLLILRFQSHNNTFRIIKQAVLSPRVSQITLVG